MNKSPAGSIQGFWRVVVAGFALCGVSIAQVSPEPPKSDKHRPNQTILFNPIPPQSASNTVPLKAVASSGLPVTFHSKTPSICSVRKSEVFLHRDGVCIVEALQTGNGLYLAASPVTQSFAVKSATRCCGLFDIAQYGTLFPPSAEVEKQASCPMPALAAESPLTPDTWLPGATVQITVRGSGFTTATDATKACRATMVTAEMNGRSIELSNLRVVNSTTITATVKVPDDLPGGLVNIMLWGSDPSKQ
jgi:hypothetical protein